MRDHRKLRAFELADGLAILVYQVTVNFPSYEQFGLTSQIRRAAVSVASNIVEGSARNSKADYVRFLEMSFASARELQYQHQLSLAYRLDYLSQTNYESVETSTEETLKVLAGLIRSLRK